LFIVKNKGDSDLLQISRTFLGIPKINRKFINFGIPTGISIMNETKALHSNLNFAKPPITPQN